MNTATSFSWKTAFLISLGVALLAGGLSILLQTHGLTANALSTRNSTPVATTSVSSGPAGLGASFEVPGKPVRLIIPAIGVDATIQSVGLAWQGNGEMGIPTNFTDVGWYNGGPRPGAPGSAVIDGHLDGRHVKEAVFYKLGTLQPGDMVEVVDATGKTRRFTVIDVKLYNQDAPTSDIFSSDVSTARLNLITCAGQWVKSENGYDQRVVVFTQLIT
ncbi:MAG: class F sortase [Candidatus Pacebacteria bacterium]|nr:class F sortase [Candidatus Paceibacterota bacterium]